MSSYIQNYGITKTVINDNNKKSTNEVKWLGNYDGNVADIKIQMDNNGAKDIMELKLDNNDIMKILGIQTVEMPLDKRLFNDFMLEKDYMPVALDSTLIQQKNKYTRRRRKQQHKYYVNKKNKKSKRSNK
jgi:hypothetical protein